MNRVLIFILLIVSWEGICQNGKPKPKPKSRPSFVSRKLFIKDTSLYSREFLLRVKQLKAELPDTIKFINNTFIGGGHFTTHFPEFLTTNKTYLLEAASGEYSYHMTITRISLSDVRFEFVLKKNKKVMHTTDGVIVLSPEYFTVRQNTKPDKTTMTSPSVRYYGIVNACEFSLYIGTENRELKAVISAPDCFFPKITKSNCPTLKATL